MQRLALFVLLSGMTLTTGCPGSIDDPLRFRSGVGSKCPDDYDVEQDLLRGTCGTLGCHTGGPSLAAAGLDLSAPGVGGRMLAHTSEACGGVPLIDPHDLDGSYLLAKLGDQPPCGDRMPAGQAELNAVERACLDEYLEALVAQLGDAAVPRPPQRDAGTGSLLPVVIEAESMMLSGYVVDEGNPGVIRIPDGVETGTATAELGAAPGRYQLRVHVRAETDGQPSLTITLGGEVVATETYPIAATDLEPVVLGPYAVDVEEGDTIVLEGRAAGTSWARVDRVELQP